MERNYLISNEGRFYKANLHCHTTCSDGMLTPEQVKELYVRHGYSIVAYTDHNNYVYHRELLDETFVPLAGYEVNSDGQRNGDGHPIANHLCALALEPEKAKMVPRPVIYDLGRINEMIRELNDAGFIVNYNHPAWSAEHTEDFLALEGITCFEVFNYGAEVSTGGGYGDQQYDLWVKSGRRAFPIATDDNHNPPAYGEEGANTPEEFDSCGGFTMIKAKELSYRAVMDAICAGNLYASNGPLIHALYIEDGKICIDCDPVCAVMLKDGAINNAYAKYAAKDAISHVDIPLSAVRGENAFARIVIMRKDGRKAWTNAYDLV